MANNINHDLNKKLLLKLCINFYITLLRPLNYLTFVYMLFSNPSGLLPMYLWKDNLNLIKSQLFLVFSRVKYFDSSTYGTTCWYTGNYNLFYFVFVVKFQLSNLNTIEWAGRFQFRAVIDMKCISRIILN